MSFEMKPIKIAIKIPFHKSVQKSYFILLTKNNILSLTFLMLACLKILN